MIRILWRVGVVGAIVLAAAGIWVGTRADGAAAPAQLTSPDHYRCYGVTPQKVGRAVTLRDRFERKRTLVQNVNRLCNPAQKNNEGMREPRAHLTCYAIRDARREPAFRPEIVRVRNQFGTQQLNLRRARALCVASLKNLGTSPPQGPNPSTLLDHFKCYQATSAAGFPSFRVLLTDQFDQVRTRVVRPETFCGPVQIDGEEPRQDKTGLVCYSISDETASPTPMVTVSNRFGRKTLNPRRGAAMCVPSTATEVEMRRPGTPPGCSDLSVQHGGAGTFRLTGRVVTSTLRSPYVTPDRKITPLGGHRWSYRSTKVDGPERVDRDFIDIFVFYPGSVGIHPTLVTCVVTVTHRPKRGGRPPRPPIYCVVIADFRLDPAQVPKTGFANFGAAISFANIATIFSWGLADVATYDRPPDDVFAPSHGWRELVNDPVPVSEGRFQRDFFVNTYWTNGNIPPTPKKPVWAYVIQYRQRAGTNCSANIDDVFLRP